MRHKHAATSDHSSPLDETAAPARAHPSWSGLLRFSLLAVPVKAYAAVSAAASPQFNQLHAGCGQRIR